MHLQSAFARKSTSWECPITQIGFLLLLLYARFALPMHRVEAIELSHFNVRESYPPCATRSYRETFIRPVQFTMKVTCLLSRFCNKSVVSFVVSFYCVRSLFAIFWKMADRSFFSAPHFTLIYLTRLPSADSSFHSFSRNVTCKPYIKFKKKNIIRSL